MKPRDLQFDLRKNPDSPRVHGLRIAVSSQLQAEQKEFQNGDEAPPTNAARMHKTFELPLGHAPNGATGERGPAARPQPDLRQVVRPDSGRLLTVEDVAALLHVPISWVYGRMRKRSLERLPAYRLGKYWRFREDEIFSWVKRQCGGGRDA